ncbi:MAG: hypothetical protein LBN97_07225 [Oscillospiraceae bacterium]|jgi:hypothetical protein|nr:hypothetical protein [Oscillospiraceae bacterium]
MPEITIANPLVYKGLPLRRNGKNLIYGNPGESHYVVLQIRDTETVKDIEVSKKVLVNLYTSDIEVKPRDRRLKKAEKDGLCAAMDVAAVWLDRALEHTPEEEKPAKKQAPKKSA